jgi:TonB family protein
MPKAEEIQIFLELTQYSIHALRAAGGRIEAGGECVLENKVGVSALLNSVALSGTTEGIKAVASVWPSSAKWHLSSETEAKLDRSADALRRIAASKQDDPRTAFAFAACNATDGGKVTTEGPDKWIMASSPIESLERVSKCLMDLNVDPEVVTPAALAGLGAVAAAIRLGDGAGPVVLWDIGSESSSLVLVTAAGAEATVACSAGMETIFEAVQSALNLKFRGAGARLFFNVGYDFTEAGPKVGAIVGTLLKAALGQLPPTASPPSLLCVTLTGKQAWFTREVAAAAGISQWAPQMPKLAAALGISFSDPAVESLFSVSSAGLLGLLGAGLRGGEWNAEWIEAQAREPEKQAPAALAPVRAPEAPKTPTPPVRNKPTLTLDPPASSSRPPHSSRPPVPPRSGSEPPVAPQPSVRPPITPPVPASARIAAVSPAPIEGSFSNPGFSISSGTTPMYAPATPLIPAPRPVVAGAAPVLPAGGPPPGHTVAAVPLEADELKDGASGDTTPRGSRKKKIRLFITLGVVAVAAIAAVAFVIDSKIEKMRARELEEQAAAQSALEEHQREADQLAKLQAEARRKEMEVAAALKKKLADEEAQRAMLAQMEVERVAKLPGTLLIATEPAGASVSIDGQPPLTTPVKADGIAPGSHHMRITLARHDAQEMDVTIKGGSVTDLGSIPLLLTEGGLELSSSPTGLEFAVRPSGSSSGRPLYTGRTPGSFAAIPHGEYDVTFVRPGSRNHVESVAVKGGAVATVATAYQNGSLELSSDPSGASVSKDGTFLGTTPLVLHDLAPRVVSFDLTLPGYDPTPVSCEIPEGQTLEWPTHLLRKDRIFNVGEAKTPPEKYDGPEPQLSAGQLRMGADVLVSFVVQSDGTVVDVKIEHSTDDAVALRCTAAVEQWKFRPAVGPGGRAVDARVEAPFKFPAQSQ